MSDSALQAKGSAIYPETATDLSAAVGKLVTFTAGAPSVNASTTIPATGIVLDARKRTVGSNTTYDNAIGIIGALPGPVRALLNASSAPVSFGDKLQQAGDGTLTKDLGAGNQRVTVAICTDLNGANPNDLFEVSFITPVAGDLTN